MRALLATKPNKSCLISKKPISSFGITIIVNLLGSEPASVKSAAAGDMVSLAVAESLDADEMEMASGDVEDEDSAGVEVVVELGCGKQKRTKNKLYNSRSFW